MKPTHCSLLAARTWLAVAVLLTLLLNSAWAATQQPYEFTYQGRLFVGSPPTTPANGQYSIRFGVFANASDPELDYEVVSVAVSDGYFTAKLSGLDGLNLNGQVRWLDIKVKASTDATPWSSVASLTGWQQLTPSPYAGYAINAGHAVNSDQLGGHTSQDFLLFDSNFPVINFIETYPNEEYLDISDSQINMTHIWNDMGASATRRGGSSMWSHPVQIGSPASFYGSEFFVFSNATVENEQCQFIDDTLPARSIWLTTTNGYDHFALMRSPSNPNGSPSFGAAQLLVDKNNEIDLHTVPDVVSAANVAPPEYIKIYAEGMLIDGEPLNDPEGDYIDTKLWVRDTTGNASQFATHSAPSSVAPAALSSFENPNIEYPWSFHHENSLLGKGAVVDIAKVMKWAEGKMQLEEGLDEGRVFYYYDLDPEKTISFDEYVETVADHIIKNKISEKPWTEIPLSSGKLPSEAWEELEVCEEREVEELKVETQIDWDSLEVKEVQKYERVKKQVPTGRYERKLKAGYKVGKGKLYRKTTVDDIEITADDIPSLPKWLLDRLPEGRLSKEDIRQRVEMMLALAVNEAKASRSVANTGKSAVDSHQTALLDP